MKVGVPALSNAISVTPFVVVSLPARGGERAQGSCPHHPRPYGDLHRHPVITERVLAGTTSSLGD